MISAVPKEKLVMSRMKFIRFGFFLFLFSSSNLFAAIVTVTPSERSEVEWTEEELAAGFAKKVVYEDEKTKHVAVRLAESEKPHTHEEDLTAWLIQGEVLLHIGDKTYPMQAGDVTRIPKQVEHWAELTSGEVCEIYAVYFKEIDADT